MRDACTHIALVDAEQRVTVVSIVPGEPRAATVARALGHAGDGTLRCLEAQPAGEGEPGAELYGLPQMLAALVMLGGPPRGALGTVGLAPAAAGGAVRLLPALGLLLALAGTVQAKPTDPVAPFDADDRLVVLAQLPWWAVRLVQCGARDAAWAGRAFEAVGTAIAAEVERGFPPEVAAEATRALATYEYPGAARMARFLAERPFAATPGACQQLRSMGVWR